MWRKLFRSLQRATTSSGLFAASVIDEIRFIIVKIWKVVFWNFLTSPLVSKMSGLLLEDILAARQLSAAKAYDIDRNN